MNIAIPRKFTNGKDLVVIPREEYDALMTLKRVYEFQPTSTQKRILLKARKNQKAGNVLTINELKQKLGLTD